MTKICIESDDIPAFDSQLRQVQDRLQTAYQNLRINSNDESDPLGIIRHEKMALGRRCRQAMAAIEQINRFVSQSVIAYERLERELNSSASQIIDSAATSKHYRNALSWAVASSMPLVQKTVAKSKSTMRYRQWNTIWFDTNHDFTYRGLRNRTLRSLIYDGIRGDGEASIHLMNLGRWSRSEHVSNHAALQVGNAEISGHVQAKLFSQQKWNPQVQAEVSAEASFIRGLIETSWHNEVLEVGLQTSGNVGVAQAKAKAVINQEEITLKGSVGAAALQGEVKGTMELFGATITVTAEGEVGGIGIGSEFSAASHSVEIGGKLSCLLGGGINIKVDW